MGDQWNDLSKTPEIKISESYWMPVCFVFVLLQENAQIESITDNFQPFYEKYMSAFGKAINAQFAPVAIPLKDLHFSGSMSYDNPTHREMMDMEGLKKWEPGRTSGFEALTEACEKLNYFA